MASKHESLIVRKNTDVIKVQKEKRYQCLCSRNQHVTVLKEFNHKML